MREMRDDEREEERGFGCGSVGWKRKRRGGRMRERGIRGETGRRGERGRMGGIRGRRGW